MVAAMFLLVFHLVFSGKPIPFQHLQVKRASQRGAFTAMTTNNKAASKNTSPAIRSEYYG
jgi:hypothetical protein